MLASRNFIDTTGPVKLVGRWVWLTGIYGFAGIIITLLVMLIGTPYGYQVVSQPCAEPCQIYGQLTAANFSDLQKIGVSTDTYAIFYVTVLWVFTLLCVGVSGLILWKKPGELLPFCAALLILFLPSIEGQFVFFSRLFQDYPFLGIISENYSIPSGIGTVYLFLTFPNGKFKGKIYWFLFICLGIVPALVDLYSRIFTPDYDMYGTTAPLSVSLGLALFALTIGFIREKDFTRRNAVSYLGLALICVLAILMSVFLSDFLVYLIVLIYRSKTVLNPREQVSTKWLIYGFTFFVFMFLAFTFIFPALPGLYEPGSYFFIFLNLIGFFGCGINLFGLFMAILYANAFDINLIIKRTVVYTTLSLLVVTVYLTSVIALQELVRFVTGQGSELAVVGATLLAALLFQPLLQAIQSFVDRRFYRPKYDAARTIAALNVSVQNETNLANLTSRIRTVIDETMQPEIVSIWVKKNTKPANILKNK